MAKYYEIIACKKDINIPNAKRPKQKPRTNLNVFQNIKRPPFRQI